MRICLLAEGCYPYVAGGVSSWIQMLINGLPEHEFVIFAIGAEKKMKGQYKYDIPPNVVEIEEHFLDEYFEANSAREKKIKITDKEKQALTHLLLGEETEWDRLFRLFGPESRVKANEFLSSDAFMDIIFEISEKKYYHTPFKDTFWTVRSMLAPVLNLLKCRPPEADIYHSVSTGYAGVMGSLFRFVSGKPFIVTEHGIYSREREEEILKADWVDTYYKQTWIDFFNSMCRAAYYYGDRIISLFHGARKTQIYLGADPEKCGVIPNGINLERFAHVPEVSLAPHSLAVGAIIRVVPIKDIKTMIQSFALVKAQRPDAVLYLIGPYDESPEYYQECREMIKTLDCRDIEFVGRVNVAEWMERLDMVILTSVSEGQPFVLLEAMAARRPVLATNVGSCKEVIEGYQDEFGPAGVVVPVMNPPQIAAGILKIGSTPEKMREYAREGYARVSKYYRDTDFLEAYRNLYEEVTGKWQE